MTVYSPTETKITQDSHRIFSEKKTMHGCAATPCIDVLKAMHITDAYLLSLAFPVHVFWIVYGLTGKSKFKTSIKIEAYLVNEYLYIKGRC